MEYLRPLRNSELMYIFKSLTRENVITSKDLFKLFKNLYNLEYSTEELDYTITHLISLSNSINTMNSVNTVNSVNSMNSMNSVGVDFVTFVNGVNEVIKTKPLEILLKSTFDNISKDKSHVTVEDLLDFAAKSGIKLSEDSKLRLSSRLPQGKANFQQFIQSIQTT